MRCNKLLFFSGTSSYTTYMQPTIEDIINQAYKNQVNKELQLQTPQVVMPYLNPNNLSGFNELGLDNLTTSSKVLKIIYLVIIAMIFGAAKWSQRKKIRLMPGMQDFEKPLESSKQLILPIFALLASGPVIQLAVGKDISILTWVGIASGVGLWGYIAFGALKAGYTTKKRAKGFGLI